MEHPKFEKPIAEPKDGVKYKCPCCKCLTLDERGGDEICQVCYWQDDGQDDPYADEVWGGPNHELSLTKARENYKRIGAVWERFKSHVRPPTQDELAD